MTINLRKQTHYLWRSNFSTQDEYENAKNHFSQMGFRVVTFAEGPDSQGIEAGIRALIQNHLPDTVYESQKDAISEARRDTPL